MSDTDGILGQNDIQNHNEIKSWSKIAFARKYFNSFKNTQLHFVILELSLKWGSRVIWWFFLKLACFSVLMRTVLRFVSLSTIHRHTFTSEKYNFNFIVCPGVSNLLIKQISGHEKSIKCPTKSIFFHATTVQDNNNHGFHQFRLKKNLTNIISEWSRCFQS